MTKTSGFTTKDNHYHENYVKIERKSGAFTVEISTRDGTKLKTTISDVEAENLAAYLLKKRKPR